MRDLSDIADLHTIRAAEIRTIAAGIWDFEERKILLEFVNDYERMARQLKANDARVVLPLRSA